MEYDNSIDNIVNCSRCQQAIMLFDKIKCDSVSNECQELFKLKGKQAAKECPGYNSLGIGEYKQINANKALRFMLAGRAEFQIVSGKTGKRLFYKLNKKLNTQNKNSLLSFWLLGGYTPSSIDYLGTVYFDYTKSQFDFFTGEIGKINKNNTLVKSIIYLLNKLYNKEYSVNIQILQNGNCGKCNKKLINVNEFESGLHESCKYNLHNLLNKDNKHCE